MPHRLHLQTRLDLDHGTVVIEVSGDLTEKNWKSILPDIRRAQYRSHDSPTTIDLTNADHIDETALRSLQALSTKTQPANMGSNQDDIRCQVIIRTPSILPKPSRSSSQGISP